MEATEEAMGSNISSTSSSGGGGGGGESYPTVIAVVRGKRTRRQRSILPPAAAAGASSTSSAESKSFAAATEEDEDMANCLILLARGRALEPPAAAEEEKLTSRRFADAATTTRFYAYECKTCSKCFPSFQALGGHRASHKKPKIGGIPATGIDEDHLQISMNSYVKSATVPIGNINSGGGGIKTRIHECSICGSEFSSGQALGGHMRRHRPAVMPEGQEGKIKERNFLSLDLNLPAPSDDDRGEIPISASVGLTFAGKRPVVFSSAAAAGALVDCHY